VLSAKCSCKAGIAGQCKHTAAAIISINTESSDSKTSARQEWGIPAAKKSYKKGTKIQQLFPGNRNKDHIERPVTIVLESFADLDCPLVYALRAANVTEELHGVRETIRNLTERVHDSCELELLGEAIRSGQVSASAQICLYDEFQSTTAYQYYVHNLNMDREEVIKVACRTIRQSQDPEWHTIRKFRISSTKAHRIFRRRADLPKLAHDLKKPQTFCTEGMRYGLRMEGVAKRLFCKQFKRRVIDSGVIVSSTDPWLCASPDGVVMFENEVSLLEIKCPASLRGRTIVDRVANVSYVKYLKVINNTVVINKKHEYYTQMQIAMYVSNLVYSHFYVYSSKEQVHLLVERDDTFLSECLPKLCSFYFKHYLPVLLEV
jgi:hypothetical protein